MPYIFKGPAYNETKIIIRFMCNGNESEKCHCSVITTISIGKSWTDWRKSGARRLRFWVTNWQGGKICKTYCWPFLNWNIKIDHIKIIWTYSLGILTMPAACLTLRYSMNFCLRDSVWLLTSVSSRPQGSAIIVQLSWLSNILFWTVSTLKIN